uniref:Uncharacterized protein n=1 Tax=Romanomermis culicivorax TaxID=13658 RepID=A0A915JRW6_ROMCU
MDDSFCQPQDRQDNTSFILSNCNVREMVHCTDIFNYFSSLFGGPHSAIEDPIFLAPENIKASIRAINFSRFHGRVAIVLDTKSGQKPRVQGAKPCDALRLLTYDFYYVRKYLYSLEKELAPKRRNNIDYILSCCLYNLELVVGEMKDKSRTHLIGISLEALNLKALMTELLCL